MYVQSGGSTGHARDNVLRCCEVTHTTYNDLTYFAPAPLLHHGPPPHLSLYHSDGPKLDDNGVSTWNALILASMLGQTAVVRELIAADGSVEHLRMQDMFGKTALDNAMNDEIKALLRAAGSQ